MTVNGVIPRTAIDQIIFVAANNVVIPSIAENRVNTVIVTNDIAISILIPIVNIIIACGAVDNIVTIWIYWIGGGAAKYCFNILENQR